MKTLLTGATGFIGSQVLERLIEGGDPARVLVRSKTSEAVPDFFRKHTLETRR